LAVGGVARASARVGPDRLLVTVDADGPRATVRDEVRSGLAGAPFEGGLGGRWVQGAFVAMLAASAGGTVSVDARDGGVRLALSLPQRA